MLEEHAELLFRVDALGDIVDQPYFARAVAISAELQQPLGAVLARDRDHPRHREAGGLVRLIESPDLFGLARIKRLEPGAERWQVAQLVTCDLLHPRVQVQRLAADEHGTGRQALDHQAQAPLLRLQSFLGELLRGDVASCSAVSAEYSLVLKQGHPARADVAHRPAGVAHAVDEVLERCVCSEGLLVSRQRRVIGDERRVPAGLADEGLRIPAELPQYAAR